MQPLVVIGAGGFGREALDVVEAINQTAAGVNYDILGVVDDRPSPIALSRLAARGYLHLGSIRDWLNTHTPAAYVIAIGNPIIRAAVSEVLQTRVDLVATVLVHPKAVLGSSLQMGGGTVVCAGAQISTNVTLKSHVHINPGAIIGHDTSLDDFVSINPGAVISGGVSVGQQTLIGAGAVVLQELQLGEKSTIGAGAVVTKNVGAEKTVIGIPAR